MSSSFLNFQKRRISFCADYFVIKIKEKRRVNGMFVYRIKPVIDIGFNLEVIHNRLMVQS
jgi:hypothetical protein